MAKLMTTVGSILYYASAIDLTIIVAFSAIASEQAKAIETTTKYGTIVTLFSNTS